MFFLYSLVSYNTSCEMPACILYPVSTDLFTFISLIYESHMLKTLCPFLGKKKKVREMWLSYFLFSIASK